MKKAFWLIFLEKIFPYSRKKGSRLKSLFCFAKRMVASFYLRVAMSESVQFLPCFLSKISAVETFGLSNDLVGTLCRPFSKPIEARVRVGWSDLASLLSRLGGVKYISPYAMQRRLTGETLFLFRSFQQSYDGRPEEIEKPDLPFFHAKIVQAMPQRHS